MSKTIPMQNEVGKRADVHPAEVEHMAAHGWRKVKAAPIDRDAVDAMKKSDLVELLEAHGADVTGNVASLRARLKAVMFVDL